MIPHEHLLTQMKREVRRDAIAAGERKKYEVEREAWNMERLALQSKAREAQEKYLALIDKYSTLSDKYADLVDKHLKLMSIPPVVVTDLLTPKEKKP